MKVPVRLVAVVNIEINLGVETTNSTIESW